MRAREERHERKEKLTEGGGEGGKDCDWDAYIVFVFGRNLKDALCRTRGVNSSTRACEDSHRSNGKFRSIRVWLRGDPYNAISYETRVETVQSVECHALERSVRAHVHNSQERHSLFDRTRIGTYGMRDAVASGYSRSRIETGVGII